jgi:anti-sigma factor RsiW
MTHAQAVRTSAAERYLLEEMPELERYAFEEHYFSCAECAEEVRLGGVMRDGVKAGLLDLKATDAQVPAPGMGRERWRAAGWLPWAVAATLALVVGYQSMRPSWIQPQALSPVTVRSASRGAETIVPLPAVAAAVALALDVQATDPGQLTYDLRGSDGGIVSSGQIQPPAPGAPLLLLFPAWTLTTGEHYILTVRHAPSGSLAGEFRFGVTQ